jgi:hypothetical protein
MQRRGTDRSARTLNVLLPQVEHSCATITGLHQQLALADVLAKFSLQVDDTGALASHQFQTLETDFLEPERDTQRCAVLPARGKTDTPFSGWSKAMKQLRALLASDFKPHLG